MFGFSIQKLLFTVAVIMAVWYGFKWVGRIKDQRDKERARLKREGKKGGGAASPRAAATDDFDDAEEMVECASCGAFVQARGARSCGRDDCPYPG
ncbi:MAG: hypothetical protein ISR51_01135 [Rhodospirillales bacterium]|nr:hypothetical protein [Alphaproteobacteria bacterium]MBL6947254.1 hypothetical protein [Rhodospirillales bacterium]